MRKDFSSDLVKAMRDYLGPKGVRFFRHLKGLKGSVIPVLKLNPKRKGMPVHPIHFREGMQIRNFLRQQDECINNKWSAHDYDDTYAHVIEEAIK